MREKKRKVSVLAQIPALKYLQNSIFRRDIYSSVC